MPRFVETLRVVHTVPHRFLAAVFTVGSCALAAGCLSGDSSRGGSGGSGADAAHSRSRQNDAHPTDDPDSSAYRVELRPKVSGQPVRGTQVLIATLYDDRGTPCPNQRVEWSLDGPGTITEVDEGPGTGPETRSAIGRTGDSERSLIRGGAEFTIRPGQSWCVVTSPGEGETIVSVRAAGTDGPRARSTVRWGGDGAQFPRTVTARAGGDYTLSIKIPMGSDTPASFRVRYRILDGPAAALTLPDGRPVESVTEATTSPAPDGSSTIRVSQPVAAAGTNRIAIQILRPNPADPSGYSTVSQGETAVTWKRPDLTIAVSAAKAVALNQEFLVTYSVGPKDAARDQPVTVTATIPRGAEAVRTEPNASRSGDQLVWNLRDDGTQVSPGVSATYRAVAAGPADFAAEVRTQDGRSGRSSAAVRVTEPKLLLKLDGPKTGLAGDTLPFKLVVTNVGDGPAEKVRVRARLDDGTEAANRAIVADETVGTLAPGQSKTTSVPITPRRGGKLAVQATASADGSLIAVPESVTVAVQKAELALSVHGPGRGYVGQEVTWRVIVRNLGDVALGSPTVRATLPPEVRFVRASAGGKASGRKVTWDLGSLGDRQTRTLELTGSCDRLTGESALSVTATASPLIDRDGRSRDGADAKSVGPARPVEAPFAIIGIPALQVTVKDSKDPIGVGEKTTYTIRVKNTGTLAAKKVVVSAEAPVEGAKDSPRPVRPIRATGPGPQGTIDGHRVSFAAIDSLAPNAEATFAIEAEGMAPGQARFRAEVRGAPLAQPLRAEEPTRVLGREPPPAGK